MRCLNIIDVEIDQGTNLYTLIDELIRWRELLDTRFKQHQLNNAVRKNYIPCSSYNSNRRSSENNLSKIYRNQIIHTHTRYLDFG